MSINVFTFVINHIMIIFIFVYPFSYNIFLGLFRIFIPLIQRRNFNHIILIIIFIL